MQVISSWPAHRLTEHVLSVLQWKEIQHLSELHVVHTHTHRQ